MDWRARAGTWEPQRRKWDGWGGGTPEPWYWWQHCYVLRRGWKRVETLRVLPGAGASSLAPLSPPGLVDKPLLEECSVTAQPPKNWAWVYPSPALSSALVSATCQLQLSSESRGTWVRMPSMSLATLGSSSYQAGLMGQARRRLRIWDK